MNEAINTERLTLAPITPEHIAAFFRSRTELGSLLGVEVPADWPVFPEGMEYWREKSDKLIRDAGWAGYLFIHRKDGRVVGDGGFKGPPDDEGIVETGYAIIPEYRGKGLATEAEQALINWAFSHPEVKFVTAETLTNGKDSMRVLEKLGMAYMGVRADPKDGAVFLWRLSREDYNTPRTPPETDRCPYN